MLIPLSYPSQDHIFIIKKGTSNFYFLQQFSHISHFISRSYNIILRELKKCGLVNHSLADTSQFSPAAMITLYVNTWLHNRRYLCLSVLLAGGLCAQTHAASVTTARPGNWGSVLDVRDGQYTFVEQIVFVENISLKFVICLLSYAFKQMANYIYVAHFK